MAFDTAHIASKLRSYLTTMSFKAMVLDIKLSIGSLADFYPVSMIMFAIDSYIYHLPLMLQAVFLTSRTALIIISYNNYVNDLPDCITSPCSIYLLTIKEN